MVLASERGLWIAWPLNEEWQVAAGSWPEGCCRDGMPMQREAMAELLADLLLDHDLIDAQVELLLPLAGLLQPRSPMLKPMALQRGHSEA